MVDNIVGMIDEFRPFIDCTGTPYCRLPNEKKKHRVFLPLRDKQVRALLLYQYYTRHRIHPGRHRISEAIEFVVGRLLAKRKGSTTTRNDPVLRCVFCVFDDDEGGCGSAGEILQLLRDASKKHKLLTGAEKLPSNATAMGKWLARNQKLFPAYGFELSRPPRGAKKRLWDWRAVIPDDTSDRPFLKVPTVSKPPNADDRGQKGAANDDVTEDEFTSLLGDALT